MKLTRGHSVPGDVADIVKKETERCEWAPSRDEPASVFPNGDDVPGNCPNAATEVVGARGSWHLCASCAALPRFARLKKTHRGER